MHGGPQPSAWDGRSRAEREHGTGRCGKQQEEEMVMRFSCLFCVWCPTIFPETMEHLGTQRGGFQSMVWLFFPVEPADAKKALRKHHSLWLRLCLPNPLSLGLPCHSHHLFLSSSFLWRRKPSCKPGMRRNWWSCSSYRVWEMNN